jgi:chemotaxis protein MotB
MAVALAGVASALACGVPEQKYKAALAENEKALAENQKAVKEGADQRVRADGLEQKLAEETARGDAAEKRAGDLSAQLAALEKAAAQAASADAAKQQELSDQLVKTRETLEAEKQAAASEADKQRQHTKQLEEEKTALAKRSAEYEALAQSLDQQIQAGQIQLSELRGKLTVRMAEKVLFPSGSATVSAAGKQTLDKIGDALKNVKGRIIRVEGHTDNVPIKTAKFPSNWELSSARAIAVVRILQGDGVDPGLLAAAGYAQYQPIAPNDTPTGRAQNRRIEISLATAPQEAPQAASPR